MQDTFTIKCTHQIYFSDYGKNTIKIQIKSFKVKQSKFAKQSINKHINSKINNYLQCLS